MKYIRSYEGITSPWSLGLFSTGIHPAVRLGQWSPIEDESGVFSEVLATMALGSPSGTLYSALHSQHFDDCVHMITSI